MVGLSDSRKDLKERQPFETNKPKNFGFRQVQVKRNPNRPKPNGRGATDPTLICEEVIASWDEIQEGFN